MGEEPRFPFTCSELTELLGSGRRMGGEPAVVWRPPGQNELLRLSLHL